MPMSEPLKTIVEHEKVALVSTYNVFKVFHPAITYFHRVSVKTFVKSVSSWEVFVY